VDWSSESGFCGIRRRKVEDKDGQTYRKIQMDQQTDRQTIHQFIPIPFNEFSPAQKPNILDFNEWTETSDRVQRSHSTVVVAVLGSNFEKQTKKRVKKSAT
jgi:hypothetical protein